MNAILPDRCEHLSDLTGLNVIVRREKSQNIYVFLDGDTEVAAYWTYKKAKAFAMGVNYGVARGLSLRGGTQWMS